MRTTYTYFVLVVDPSSYVVNLVPFEVVVEHHARPETAQHEHHAHDRRQQSELHENNRYLRELFPGEMISDKNNKK